MPKIKQTENEVKKAVKEYLEYKGYSVYRINNGGVFRGTGKDGKNKFSFAGDAGVADLYAVKVAQKTLWVETKATGKVASKSQIMFAANINSTGHSRWFCVDSLDAIRKYID